MHVMMVLSYDGSKFSGFQVQNSGVRTVANKLYTIFHSLGIFGKIDASGRTDKGVHALAQVISLDLPPYWSDLKKLKKHLNRRVLPEIYIETIQEVDASFHARYSAKKRQYRYIISTGKPNVFQMDYVCFTQPFDADKIQDAIHYFEGKHDFSYFMKQNSDVSHALREIYKARFYKHGSFYICTFEASGYLRSQIRMMVAFLLEIGRGKLTGQDLRDQLDMKSKKSSALAAPNGLYLSRIWY